MSKIIATSAINGAYSIVNQAEEKLKEAIEKKGKTRYWNFPIPVTFYLLYTAWLVLK
ncbi:MAG: hypothetical protein U5N58_06960 [Actinomycetota bacterium]|nr:hypothetical protein [Actinomycetota bacterium]